MNFIKRKVFIKNCNKIKITTGYSKGFIGQIIGLNSKKGLFIIKPFFNLNLFEIKLLKKMRLSEAYNVYNEKDFLHSQNIIGSFQKFNYTFVKEKAALFYCILNIKKKKIIAKKRSKKYLITNFTNVKLCKKVDNSLSNIKQNKFLFLKNLNLIE